MSLIIVGFAVLLVPVFAETGTPGPGGTRIQEQNPSYVITGVVLRPGIYRLDDQTTVDDAIRQAGGLTQGMRKTDVQLSIVRGSDPNRKAVQAKLATVILDKDVVVIKRKSGATW